MTVDSPGPTRLNTDRLYNLKVMEDDATDTLSTVFGALADPTRRAILARLADGDDLTVGELSKPFRMSQPAVSRHLKVLERAGLISRRRRQTARLSHLEGEGLKDAADWLARYEALWQERHDRLEALLGTLQGPDPEAAAIESPR
jgi:DNA-binding transcriptional ArsR family regulator